MSHPSTALQRYASPEEREITRKLLRGIFTFPGIYVRVFDGGDLLPSRHDAEKVEADLASTGADWLNIYDATGKRVGAVWLVWGNGRDLISDWTDNPWTNELVESLIGD